MIKLYQFEVSPFCDKVRRVMNFKGLDYEAIEVSLQAAVLGKTKKINPTGKLPAVEINGQCIGDSSDIVLALEEMYPEKSVIPSSPELQAKAHLYEDWADESLYFYEVFFRFVVEKNAKQWSKIVSVNDNFLFKIVAKIAMPLMVGGQAKAQGVGKKSYDQNITDVARHFAALNQIVSTQDWLVGDALSIADISVFCQVAAIASTPEGFSVLEQFEELKEWMSRVDAETCAKS